jgi:hypothetical protein
VTSEAPLGRWAAFAVVALQLALVVLTVYAFEIESKRHLLPVLIVAVSGFAIHAWLPARFRLAFFCFLSFGAIFLLLGWPDGAWVIGIGSGLIVLCHLPIPLPYRLILLGVAGLQLAACRVVLPAPFWPVLGSMFMFRLMVYVYDTGHARVRPPLFQTLAYFFTLPNVCFPLFPVIDFQTLRETYYDEDPYVIYQNGIGWIVRGLTHLLLYRFIKYYLLPSPHQLHDLGHLALFLAANYALYLRISGIFHLSIGILHLFGFHLPRTHDHYFLASSFSDIWKRINIYWKDFITKLFFLPAFFALRGLGTGVATVLAVFWAFLATWLLHTYQVFWVVGDLEVSWKGAALWLGVAAVVAINLQFDLRRRGHEPGITPGRALVLTLRVIGMFWLVSIFWAFWNIRGFFTYVRLPSVTLGALWPGIGEVGAIVLMAVLLGVVGQLVRAKLIARGLWPLPLGFRGSAAAHVGLLTLLVVAASPAAGTLLGSPGKEMVATLRHESAMPVEAAQAVQGYYEDVAAAPVKTGALLAVLESREPPSEAAAHYTVMTRPTDDLLERELIPGWRGELGGSRITVNRLGMRDREGITRQKPPGTYRIALVGSSVVMGYGVEDDQVFGRLLEECVNADRLRPQRHYEVLNFGAGISFAIQRRVLIDRKVFAFEPDAIYYLAHQDELLGPVRHLAKLVAKHRELPYPCLQEVVREAGITPDTSWGLAEARLQPFARQIVLGIYQDLVAACRARGVLPVWVYLPMPGVVEISVRSAEFVSLAEEAGFVVVNLADWADAYEPAEVKLSAQDHHANALGHRIIAERLEAEIRKRPELLAR